VKNKKPKFLGNRPTKASNDDLYWHMQRVSIRLKWLEIPLVPAQTNLRSLSALNISKSVLPVGFTILHREENNSWTSAICFFSRP
jgi:hypothetical protein